MVARTRRQNQKVRISGKNYKQAEDIGRSEKEMKEPGRGFKKNDKNMKNQTIEVAQKRGPIMA